MAPFSHLPLRCWAEIDLAALERNLKAIRNALPDRIRYIAVVKADSYGHGMHQTVARLMQSGVDMFAVANVTEAATIREIGSGWPILSLGACLEDEDPYIFEYGITPTISTVEELTRLDAKAKERNRILEAHLKLDTGMGRLGIWHEFAETLFAAARAAENIAIAGVYTHFAAADRDPSFTQRQRDLFTTALDREKWLDRSNLLIHADNSAGISTFAPDSVYNAVRIGLLQFGISPYPKSILGNVSIDPIFCFKTRIGIVKNLPAGANISYGRTATLKRDSLIAVLCAGYGDGIPRILSNRGEAIIDGVRCPVLGRITMDQTIVDVTDLPNRASQGAEAVLIGTQGQSEISLEEFSQWAETISWEVLCSITKRVPRLYRTLIN